MTRLDPKNKAAVAMAHRLMTVLSAKRDAQRSTKGVGQELLDAAEAATAPPARLTAARNLAAFSQEGPGALELQARGVVSRLVPMLGHHGEPEMLTALLHMFAQVASASAGSARYVLAALGAKDAEAALLALVQATEPKVVRGAVLVLSKVLESCSSGEGVPSTEDATAINKVLDYLVALVPHRGIVADARDAAIAAIVTNAKRADVAKRIIDRGGVRALLITASCARTPLQAADRGDGVATSGETRMQVSVAMSELHRATGKKVGKKLEPYERLKADCLGALAWTKDPVSNVPVVYTLVAVIQGVIDLANDILDTEGVMDEIIKMAKERGA